MVVSHFSKSISQTTTFWELGLGFFGIRVILRGKSGFYAGVRFGEMVFHWKSTQFLIFCITDISRDRTSAFTILYQLHGENP